MNLNDEMNRSVLKFFNAFDLDFGLEAQRLLLLLLSCFFLRPLVLERITLTLCFSFLYFLNAGVLGINFLPGLLGPDRKSVV